MSEPSYALHYTGHMISPPGKDGRFPAENAPRIERALDDLFREYRISAGYGSMASGADILIAERILACGAPLHVVLPFALETFIEGSVRPAGADWPDRCRAAIARASSVRVLDPPQDPAVSVYAHTTAFAMDRAVQEAPALGLVPLQIAVWDGSIGAANAGAWHDIKTWQARGLTTIVIGSKSGEVRHLTGAKIG